MFRIGGFLFNGIQIWCSTLAFEMDGITYIKILKWMEGGSELNRNKIFVANRKKNSKIANEIFFSQIGNRNEKRVPQIAIFPKN